MSACRMGQCIQCVRKQTQMRCTEPCGVNQKRPTACSGPLLAGNSSMTKSWECAPNDVQAVEQLLAFHAGSRLRLGFDWPSAGVAPNTNRLQHQMTTKTMMTMVQRRPGHCSPNQACANSSRRLKGRLRSGLPHAGKPRSVQCRPSDKMLGHPFMTRAAADVDDPGGTCRRLFESNIVLLAIGDRKLFDEVDTWPAVNDPSSGSGHRISSA